MLPVANNHTAGGCGNGNQFLSFDIPMLLGNNYGITVYKNSQIIIATPFSNKISVMTHF